MMVTPLYAGLLVVLFVLLSSRVIASRLSGKVAFGDGGDRDLLRRIRGHANFVEYVPLALLMMAVLELSRYSIYVLHALGILLLIARVLHGYAFSFAAHSGFGRRVGAALTLLVLVIEAVLCLYQALIAHSVWLRI